MNNKDKKYSILIVDDERNSREGIQHLLKLEYNITVAEDGIRALNILKRRDFDLVLTDLKMPGADGIEILRETLRKNPCPKCIILTAYGSVENAVQAMKSGAFDFIQKPVNLDHLELLVKRALEAKNLAEENIELKRKLKEKFEIENIIGNSPAMHQLLETVKQVAPTRTTVLVTGESGTGKELIAQALHSLSGRTGPFVPVHCAALPANLLESELFGHEKGAFTGAVERRKGRFEMADGGTLFLDEIGEIDQSVQVKILRALETRIFERVGGSESVSTDTRVVAATNRDLKLMVSEGKFREDLFYRLYVVTIAIPPLRERKEDIPILVRRFIDEFSKENKRDVMQISDDAVNLLCVYDWPGNIRELRNCIERMVVLARKKTLDVNNIPEHIKEKSTSSDMITSASGSLNLDENERVLISRALDKNGGNISKASKTLGISRRTLHRKLQEAKK